MTLAVLGLRTMPRSERSTRTAYCWPLFQEPQRLLRRALHDDESGAVQVFHKAFRGYRGHILVSLMDPLAAVVAQSKGQRLGEVARVGGRELVSIGHARTIAASREHSKNGLVEAWDQVWDRASFKRANY